MSNTQTSQEAGMPISELKRLVSEDNARLDELCEFWPLLHPAEQRALISQAEKFSGDAKVLPHP